MTRHFDSGFPPVTLLYCYYIILSRRRGFQFLLLLELASKEAKSNHCVLCGASAAAAELVVSMTFCLENL